MSRNINEKRAGGRVCRGIGAAPGMAHGRLSFRRRAEARCDEQSRRTPAEERARFDAARDRARADIEELASTAAWTASSVSNLAAPGTTSRKAAWAARS